MDKGHGLGSLLWCSSHPFAQMPSLLLLDAAAEERTVVMNVSFVVDLTLLDCEGQMLTSN